MIDFAITFGQLNPKYWLDAVVAADEHGFESAWLPEHLVFPVEMAGQLIPGEELEASPQLGRRRRRLHGGADPAGLFQEQAAVRAGRALLVDLADDGGARRLVAAFRAG